MTSVEERVCKMTHEIAHKVAEIYKILAEAQAKVDVKIKNLLLYTNEVNNIKEKNDRENHK